jgi:uncharacterized damage-inducible protein DinB
VPTKLQRFTEEWKFDRQLTADLLRTLSHEELLWSPSESVGALWKQFRHLGRVQENYMKALETGRVNFDTQGGYRGTADGAALLHYLQELDKQLASKVANADDDQMIEWFGGERITAFEHLRRMMSHETLHHGQLIVYFRLMNKPFPDSWKIWGL